MQVIGGDNLEHLRGKQVIVVEDIVDTGNTIRKLMNVLAKYDPKSVKGAFLYFLKMTLIFSRHNVVEANTTEYERIRGRLLGLLDSGLLRRRLRSGLQRVLQRLESRLRFKQ